MQVISVNTILTYICIYSYIREGWCYNHSCVVGALWYFKWIQKFRFYAKSHCKIFLAELNFFLKLNVTRISAKCHNKKCKNVILKIFFKSATMSEEKVQECVKKCILSQEKMQECHQQKCKNVTRISARCHNKKRKKNWKNLIRKK